jgi:hypothetical protein
MRFDTASIAEWQRRIPAALAALDKMVELASPGTGAGADAGIGWAPAQFDMHIAIAPTHLYQPPGLFLGAHFFIIHLGCASKKSDAITLRKVDCAAKATS